MTATHLTTGTILDRILERTAADVATRRGRTPVEVLRERAGATPAALSLADALAGPGVSVIAEIKRGSPSRGVFPVAVDPPAVARAYLEGGAAALSVLTDEPHFLGSLADLEAVAAVAHLPAFHAPVLRKDFIVDAYQIVEARAAGADAILLIVAALDDATLAGFLALAGELGMDALVEVHDEAEMRRAIGLGAKVVGVNNRDLRDFAVDLATTERLAPMVPAGTVLVGESGIFTRADVERLGRAGAHAVLVGEGLIVQDDRAAAVRALLGDRGGPKGDA